MHRRFGSERRRGYKIVLGVLPLLVGSVAMSFGTTTAGALCSNYSGPGNYWHAQMFSSYSYVDGVSAQLSVHTSTPYVCDEPSEHVVESLGGILPYKDPNTGNPDFAEIGITRGTSGGVNGTHNFSGQLYFFTFTDYLSQGNSVLNWTLPTSGSVMHTYYAQLGGNGTKQWVDYKIDATDLGITYIPLGDAPYLNSSNQLILNGEVENNNQDVMPNATFTALAWGVGGTYHPWSNYSAPPTPAPYCSLVYPTSPPYSFQNWGPMVPTTC